MSLHEQWYKIVTQHSFLNMTAFFKVPYQEILRDLYSLSNWKDYCCIPRNPQEYNFIKSISAGNSIGGDIFIKPRGWKSFSVFNRTGKSHHTIVHNFFPTTNKMEHLRSYRMIKHHQWTELKSSFPSLQKWVLDKILPYFHPAFIRIAILEPGGIIPPHNDIPPEIVNTLGSEKITSYNILNSFNISLHQSSGNIFCLNNKLIDFSMGDAYWINTGKTHWAVNMGNDIRIHLQIHGLYKKSYRKYVVENISLIKCGG